MIKNILTKITFVTWILSIKKFIILSITSNIINDQKLLKKTKLLSTNFFLSFIYTGNDNKKKTTVNYITLNINLFNKKLVIC